MTPWSATGGLEVPPPLSVRAWSSVINYLRVSGGMLADTRGKYSTDHHHHKAIEFEAIHQRMMILGTQGREKDIWQLNIAREGVRMCFIVA